MKLFLDHNLSYRIAEALRPLVEHEGHRAQSLFERYDTGQVDDVTWIGDLDREGGWTFVTLDNRIRKRPQEREAWRRSGLVGFFLAPGWTKMHPREQTARLLLWWSILDNQSRLVARGGGFAVPINVGRKLEVLRG